MRFQLPWGSTLSLSRECCKEIYQNPFFFISAAYPHAKQNSVIQIALQNLPLSRRFQWALSRVDYASNIFAHFYATPGFVRALLLNCSHLTYQHFNKSHEQLYRLQILFCQCLLLFIRNLYFRTFSSKYDC